LFRYPQIHTGFEAEIFQGIFCPVRGYCVVVADSVAFARFEQTVMPHLHAAYNLARWLLRDHHDAEDAVQDAYLRAFRFFDGFDGGDARAWLLAIVRNRCRTALEQSSRRREVAEFDEKMHTVEEGAGDPESGALRNAEIQSLRACIEDLPVEYREVVVLRELEQLSYKEIAVAAAVPVGTVMSRLARARIRLKECIAARVRGVAR
jgi:RNA polymerase sigma-70 factor, ECF subfamily